MAVAINGSNLEYVPQASATERVLVRAIQEESHSLAFVDFEHYRKDFIDNLAFVAITFAPTALEHVPFMFQNERLVREACSRLPLALKHVAPELKTEELCLKAIEQDVKAIKYTPPELLSNKLIDECLSRSPWVIADIPDICMTKERIIRCAKKSGQVIQAIPTQHHSAALYRAAFDQDPMSISYMTNIAIRNEVVKEALLHEWPFDLEYEPQNEAQAEKFLRSEKAKHSPHLACAYEAYLSNDVAKKIDPRNSSCGMDF